MKNFTEKISIIEEKRNLDGNDINQHFLETKTSASSLILSHETEKSNFSEREILYKILFDLKNDLNDLKKITLDSINGDSQNDSFHINNAERIQRIYNTPESIEIEKPKSKNIIDEVIVEENLSLQDNECEMIQKALEKNKGKRKIAAKELGISERTLYRKIRQYGL